MFTVNEMKTRLTFVLNFIIAPEKKSIPKPQFYQPYSLFNTYMC